VGVWVGNASGAPMWDVSGTTGAAPIWAAVMHQLHRQRGSRAPQPPAGLVQKTVTGGRRSTPQRMVHQQGHRAEQSLLWKKELLAHIPRAPEAQIIQKTSSNSAPSTARITAPTSGTILALDPDIPPRPSA